MDLAESAFLAGINDGPNMYNPYGEEDNSELIKSRTKLVLHFMKEQKVELAMTQQKLKNYIMRQ